MYISMLYSLVLPLHPQFPQSTIENASTNFILAVSLDFSAISGNVEKAGLHRATTRKHSLTAWPTEHVPLQC